MNKYVLIIAILTVAVAICVYFIATEPRWHGLTTYTSKDGTPYKDGMLPDNDKAEICELLLKVMMRNHDSKLACFVSVEVTYDNNNEASWKAPSDELLSKFASFPFPVLSSAMMYLDHGQIKHKGTGNPGCVYAIKMKRQISKTKFIVEVFRYCAPLSAVGFIYYLHKDGGVWNAEDTGEGWIS